MQTRTGLPLAEAWRDVDNGQRWVMDWSKKIYKDVALLFNDVKPNRQGVLGGYLAIRDPARRLDFAKANNMSRKELRAAAVARKLLREAVGEYYQDMISDDIPSYLTKRAVGGRDIEVPVDLKPWLDYGLQPELWDHGANLVDSVIRTKMRRVLGERVESAEAMLKSALKEGKVKGETAREIKRAFMKYILGVENSISGDLVNTTRVIQYLNETFGLQLKGDLAGNLANSAIQIIYASTMAFRPGIALRNLMQTFVTLTPYVGPKAVLEGYRKAFTPEGQRWAKRFQVWTQAHIPVEEFVHGSSLVPGAIRKGMLVGMTPFKSADAMTRAAAVNAARYLWGLHYPKFASGEMSLREFMRNTGLVYLEKAAQVEVLRALDTGKTDHALHMYADNLSDSTLWIYRSGNSPMLFKSAAGRLMGQFGTWPISYIRWATRGLMSGKEDPMAALRFAVFWYAVNQSLLELGRSVLGTDFSSWLFAGPFLFTGGPALQFLATARNLTAAPEYMRERAWQGVKRTATALIPFYGAGRDLNDTLNAEDWREALREFFGQREAK